MYLGHVLRWHSYIDDIMLIWQGPEQLLQEFVAKLNVNRFNLTLTLNYHSTRLEFLDMEIKVDNPGQVSTNLYHKKNSCAQRSSSNEQGETRLILTFNTNEKEIHSLIRKHWNILSKDPTIGQLVPSHPLFCYRRNTNIGDSLTHSHFQQQSRATCCKTLGSYKCGACEQCQYIKVSINFGNRNASYDMYHYTCCTTTHVIYLFIYLSLRKYVGKTKRPFRRHIYEHMRDIRNCNLLSAIAKHIFCIHNGHYTGSYFQGINRLHGDIRGGDLNNKLLQLETTWNFRLNTYKSEFGLNGHLNF
ncbi:hypothetical protein XELAEV_18034994mg [Xenopus laevis]|uniref:Reverse transcriptase domain-containing protein n=1 Tax=Xenopus laevis TaxID=8355 RepID=A0A974CFF8_XENLA|nr:hypothetical protein XELAEV_18034994mg [Xenopus laevis]